MARLSMIGLLLAIFVVAGCQSTPPERALQMPAASVDVRQVQTRRFEQISETQLLAASAGVLQDLGFNIDESETELGLIVASKRQSVSNPGTETMLQMLKLFADIEIPVDKEQRIRASLVSRPVPDATQQFFVRVTFQRVVWNTENDISKRETLDDPVLYQEFFDRLSKSVFLEAHSI